jgi:predicted nucleic acid-binding protein
LKALYLETSALLAWLLGEPSAAEAKMRVDTAQAVATSWLTLLEAERTLVRGETLGVLKAAEAEKLRGLLNRSKAGWLLMEISQEVRERAAQVFPLEPVRTLDAIHLATALIFMRVFPSLELLSFDSRILRNAESLGIATRVSSPDKK